MIPALLVSAILAQVPANNVSPRIGYVYPPGAKTGTTLDVRLGAYDWTPDVQVFVHDPGVKIEITGERVGPMHTPPPFWFGRSKADLQQPPVAYEFPARVTIAPGTKPGPVRWQVASANGASAMGTFVVSGLNEVIEPETNKSLIELPTLPAAASGRISRITEIDEYRFTVAKAGLVTCKLDDRVGQAFDGTLIVRDAKGNVVADSADTVGGGLTVTFNASAGGVYTAAVSDADHAGDRGYVYRLTVEQAPEVIAVSPLVVARGKTTPIDVFGRGVATGKDAMETTKQSAAVPADAKDEFRYEFTTPAGKAAVKLAVGDATDALEPTTDDIAKRPLAAGTRMTARFDKLDAELQMPVDRYTLSATKGSVFRIGVEAAKFHSPVDPSIAVVAEDGKELARNDDLLGTTDAAVDFTAPADGTYTVVVTDFSGTEPSPTHLYRLVVDDAATAFDFTVSVPDKFDIVLGSTADLVVKSSRVGQWDEPIAIKLENLPAGVTQPETPAPPPPPPPVKGAKPKPVPKARKPLPGDIKVPVVAADNMAVEAKPVMVVAMAEVEGKKLERRVGPILVAVKLKTRCVVKSAVQDGGRVINRGTTYPADVIIERLEGYEGPVTLEQASTQSRQRRGIDGPTFVVPAGVTAVKYPVKAPEWLETSQTCRMNLLGIIEIADPKGNKRYVTGVMDGQIVMSMEGAILKTSHEPMERRVALGGEIDIPVKVSRTVKLKAPAKVFVVPDEDFPDLFTAETVTLPLSQGGTTMKIRVAKEPKAAGLRHVVIRATAMQDGKWPATSDTRVSVIVESGAAVAAK
jgi:hypothetical protein